MNIRASYLQMINAFPGGWEGIAGALGLTRVALSNRIYGCKGQAVSVDQAIAMQSLSNNAAFAEAVAYLAGGTFVKLPDVEDLDREELLSMFNRFYAKVGELPAKYERYAADGAFDPREREDINDTTHEIHRALAQLHAVMLALYCPSAPGRG